MELNLSKQAVTINEMVYEGNLEQPIESDVLLPDYCPDIVKILRCFLETRVTGTQISGEKLTVDMSCTLKIYYLGADKNIRCNEQRMPYTKSCEIRGAAPEAVIDTLCKTDYLNCRAVNQRRFEVRGAVSVFCRVFSRASAEIVCGATGGGIQVRAVESEISEIIGDASREFSQHEDLQVAASKPAVQSIIRQECFCRTDDFKLISGKVIVKGELMVHLLYQPDGEASAPELMEYALPISQIVDLEGVEEDTPCEVDLMVVSCEFTPRVNLEGESRLLAMDCVMKARVRAHRHSHMTLITDCYSTECECRMDKAPVSCLTLTKVVNEKAGHKGEMTLPEGTCRVLDMFCHVTDASTRSENGAVVAVVQVLASAFVCNEQGDISYHEQSGECEIRVPYEGSKGTVLFTPHTTVCACSYSLNSCRLEYRCELLLTGCLYLAMRPKAATAIVCDTEKPKARMEDASLIIYYAAPGEDVWEIAKRYNTSMGEIMSENALEGTALRERRMLLIPIV